MTFNPSNPLFFIYTLPLMKRTADENASRQVVYEISTFDLIITIIAVLIFLFCIILMINDLRK